MGRVIDGLPKCSFAESVNIMFSNVEEKLKLIITSQEKYSITK